jgi:hypothetical protein
MYKRNSKETKKEDPTKPIMVNFTWIEEPVDLLGCRWCTIYKNSPCELIFTKLGEEESSKEVKNELKRCVNVNKSTFIFRDTEFERVKKKNQSLIEKRTKFLNQLYGEVEEEEEEK